MLGLPAGPAPTVDAQELLNENVLLRREIQLRKRGRADELEDHGGIVANSRRPKKAAPLRQEERNRMSILSAIHAVKCRVPICHVGRSLAHAHSMAEELDPEYVGTHVFATMPHRTSLSLACQTLSDALDSHYDGILSAARISGAGAGEGVRDI